MIRVGIGGWVFPPWRGEFYPKGLAQARELEYASRKLTTIEINGTFYSTQKPESFRKWAEATPDDFVFSLKGPRYATHRRVLAEAGESIERFFRSGVLELRGRLVSLGGERAVEGVERRVVGDESTAELLGVRLADRLLAQGGAEILAQVRTATGPVVSEP